MTSPTTTTSPRSVDHDAMTAVIAVVGALSLSFNGFALVVFARNRLLRTVNNWLVANLAVSDLLYVVAACVIALSDSLAGHVGWTRPLCRSVSP